MTFNIRSIPAFEKISDSNIQIIENEGKFLKYSFGQPICKKDVIPNEVLIILDGEARLIIGNNLESLIQTKIGKHNFIGLSSILNVKGCEFVTASSDLTVLSLKDELILNLYQNEPNFSDWCNKNIQISEAYEMANILLRNKTSNILDIKDSANRILNCAKIDTFNNKNLIKDKDLIYIVGSDNINNFKPGDVLEPSKKVTIRGPLPARVFKINIEIYHKLISLESSKNKNPNNIISNELEDINIQEAEEILYPSAEKIGQYNENKKFKLIKASGEIRECLACLQMLASQLDVPYRVDSIEKILRDTIRRGKKPTIELLGGITTMMGLHTTSAKIDPKNGNRLPTPSIIVWKESFALVKESNSRFLEIVSPTEGIIQLNSKQFNDNFSKGYIELLLVEKTDQTPETKFGLKWLIPSINRYRNILLQVLLASFVVQLFGLANPLMIQVIIDKVISQRSLDTLQILGIALVVVTILGGILSSLRTFLFTETTNRIDTRLGSEVIDHLLRLPLNYFDKRPVGELGQRISELQKIRDFLTGQALTTILDGAFSIIYIIVMVIYSWKLTFIALGVVPIQILITVIGSPLIRRQIREIAQQNAKTQSHLIEVLTGIQTVKAQNVERVSRWKWQELYSKFISKSFEKTITSTALGQTSQVLQQLSQLLVLWAGAVLVLEGKLSLGQLIAFRIISGYVTQPLLRLSTIWQNIQELKVSFERLADIIDTPQEATEIDKGKIPLPSIEGKVEFENVSFSFLSNQPLILNNINLKVNAGNFIGIVGQSGSGKSTLVKLLPRLYNPNSGRLLIDGYDINKVELYSLRRQIGIVPQEPLLFAGTVNENISLIDPEAPSDEIVKVSKIADAHDFIMGLQDGYNTNVGERGSGLSGGQKQRIAIARTLLSNPKLIIMDEATSALDYETERKVCEGIKDSCKDSTVFFITHRLSTVKNADLLVMLHQGSIVEIGSHQELMDLKGRYFALYRQQEST